MKDYRLICPKCNRILQYIKEDFYACHDFYEIIIEKKNNLIQCGGCNHTDKMDIWMEYYKAITRNKIKFKEIEL